METFPFRMFNPIIATLNNSLLNYYDVINFETKHEFINQSIQKCAKYQNEFLLCIYIYVSKVRTTSNY